MIFDTVRFIPRTSSVRPLDITVYKGANPARFNSSNQFLNARILDEVTVKGARMEGRSSHTIGAPDQIVSGAWLRSLNSNDVLMSLQSKVPGLRSAGGVLRLGSPTTFNVRKASDAEPLVLIDGVPINGFSDETSESTASFISNLSPQDIERIEIFKYSSGVAYGSRGANGVISITTRKTVGGNRGVGERGRFERINITGFSSVNKFSSPNYTAASDLHDRADYRSTIYWNPNVSTDEGNLARISFYAADLPGQYRIIIEGITHDGTVVHGEKLLTIVEKP